MPPRFVGREELIGNVAQRLTSGASLALSADGLPGVGKTTLAVALSYRRDVLDHFTDGVLWGGLGLQPNVMEVLASWGAALREDVSEATTPETRAQQVRSAIGQRRLLLVIDDAWPPAETTLLLRCGGPNCAHFLTTRHEEIAEAFAGAGGTVGIRELGPEDALHLLRMLAPEACEADPEAAAGLVQAVGCLPLAIELVGAYLAAPENRHFPSLQKSALGRIADPGERLRQACRRLGDAQGTVVTLGETIRLSLDGLAPEVVEAFHALGAFAPKPETFDLRAAVSVTGASPEAVSVLVGRRLVDKQGETLSLHQTIADVARAECPANTVECHADHYLLRAHASKEEWQEIEAVYGQTKWAFDRLDDAEPMTVLAFAEVLRDYQDLRGLRSDQLAWSDREIAAAFALDDDRRRALALHSRGLLHDRLGEWHRALEYYEQVLPLRHAVGDPAGMAVTLNNIGSIDRSRGEWDRALEYYEQALPLARAAGDQAGEGAILNNIGSFFHAREEHDRALDYYEQALPLLRAGGNRVGEAATLDSIGSVYNDLGDRGRALEYHEQSLSLRRGLGDRHGEASSLNNIGFVHHEQGNWNRALEYFGQALPLRRDLGNLEDEAIILSNIGSAYGCLGERERALEYHEQALSLQRAIGNQESEATTLNNIGSVYRELGERERALEYYELALPLARAVGDQGCEGLTLNNIGLTYHDMEEWERALEHYSQALPLRRAVRDQAGEGTTLFNVGMVYYRVGQPERALEHFEQALLLWRAVGDRANEARTLTHAALVYQTLGEPERALGLRGAGASDPACGAGPARRDAGPHPPRADLSRAK